MRSLYNQGNVNTSLLNLVPNSTCTLSFRVFSQPEDTKEEFYVPIAQHVLAILKGLCTRLEHLEGITIRLPPREALDSQTLLHKHRLHSITVIEPKFTLDELRRLCTGQSLTSLSFAVPSDAVVTTTPRIALKTVRSLALRGNWAPISTALTSLVVPHLRTIKLSVDSHRYASFNGDMSSFCARLASGQFPAVDDVQVALQEPKVLKPPPGSQITRPLFGLMMGVRKPFTVPVPLLQLRGLRRVSIQYSLSYLEFTFTPDALHPFANAWPNLEHFCLSFPEVRDGSLP